MKADDLPTVALFLFIATVPISATIMLAGHVTATILDRVLTHYERLGAMAHQICPICGEPLGEQHGQRKTTRQDASTSQPAENVGVRSGEQSDGRSG